MTELSIGQKTAKKYQLRETNRFSRHYHTQWSQKIIEAIPYTPREVLDYCCGTSVLFPLIKLNFPSSNYTGIDISKEMLKVGKRKYGNERRFHTRYQDGQTLKFQNYFDVAISRGGIHHLSNPAKGIRNVYNALGDHGLFIVTEPTSNFIVKFFRKMFYEASSHFSHTHRSFTKSEIISLLEDNGFVVRRVKYFGLLAFPFGFPDMIGVFPYWIPRTLEEIDKFLLKIPIINSFSCTMIITAVKI